MVASLNSDRTTEAVECWRCKNTSLHTTFPSHPRHPLRENLCNRCSANIASNITLHNRNARKWKVDGHLAIADWLQILHDSQGYCSYCKGFIGFYRLTIEHVMPMVLSDANTPANIVAACAPCNVKKARSSVDHWQQRTETQELLDVLQQTLHLSKETIIHHALKDFAKQKNIDPERPIPENENMTLRSEQQRKGGM